MAEIDKPKFKFPDEKESEEHDDNILIEIENDAPEQDKNKEPLPESLKEELYSDDLTDYSTKVKKKLLQLKHLAHDERREKERVYRENHEAIALANRLVEENKRLKQNLHDNQNTSLQTISKNVEMEIEKAKNDYRAAYESGDTDKIIEAQQKLTDLSLKNDKVKNFKPVPLQNEQTYAPIQQQPAFKPPPVDPTAVRWQKNNTWFGKDKQMTSMALGLHEELREEGVIIASEEYYKRIDDTMRQRFPEKFENEEKDERPTRPSTIVAPATRSTSPKKIRLNTSQIAIAKKLGLTPEQYAQAVLKLES